MKWRRRNGVMLKVVGYSSENLRCLSQPFMSLYLIKLTTLDRLSQVNNQLDTTRREAE